MKRVGGVILQRLQPLGRALMLPIAVLPIAALLLRLGQPDMLDVAFVAAAGDAIFANLGLLFAIGVAVGLARENHGAAGLAGVVCFLVATKSAESLLPGDAVETAKAMAKLSVPAGITAGLAAGVLYNRFSDIALPPYLGFFAGRRFVPIAGGLAGLAIGVALGVSFPWFERGVDGLSYWVVTSGPIGLFVYGLLNRLLLVTGLHHILNNIAWFLIGDFHGATGDLKRFFAGDPQAGGFMAGFFPVMMFGLPAACLAMYRAALPQRRKAVSGLYLSLALTAFLTGVTEPIEFTFLFLAPLLFLIHAILTGLAMVIMSLLGVRLGFGFSAGLLDYVLNYGLATRPLLLIPVGIAYAAIYYAAFAFCIRRFDLKTPGRDAEVSAATVPQDRTSAIIGALGGAGNLVEVDACTTRLRLVVSDANRLDEAALRASGARGVLKLGSGRVQVVVGTEADQLARAIRQRLAGGTPAPTPNVAGLVRALHPERLEIRGRRLIVMTDAAGQAQADLFLQAGVQAAMIGEGSVHLIGDWQGADWIGSIPQAAPEPAS
ncbi:N-acetylglucosamine-specific PTS transporter subunit IIBC [Novosphingobium sp. 9U]|uniref:N-acetylglucosamine-specific PTS transporter subunit IIBC n=1 Tax=Novosphingobium sp. 9U TaxID=2653158 RepID=UPI0012F15B18|nr:N-acetylglucosamine-specific PTS transporter subunit IIBC [Novosphingobium sp. 9U]VWX46710.1 N-acetylglucosamine permease IIC component / N-acetylglucosamine-specific phosphotransferase enzyme IIB component [Novosphingobium sp. 9U]